MLLVAIFFIISHNQHNTKHNMQVSTTATTLNCHWRLYVIMGKYEQCPTLASHVASKGICYTPSNHLSNLFSQFDYNLTLCSPFNSDLNDLKIVKLADHKLLLNAVASIQPVKPISVVKTVNVAVSKQRHAV